MPRYTENNSVGKQYSNNVLCWRAECVTCTPIRVSGYLSSEYFSFLFGNKQRNLRERGEWAVWTQRAVQLFSQLPVLWLTKLDVTWAERRAVIRSLFEMRGQRFSRGAQLEMSPAESDPLYEIPWYTTSFCSNSHNQLHSNWELDLSVLFLLKWSRPI